MSFCEICSDAPVSVSVKPLEEEPSDEAGDEAGDKNAFASQLTADRFEQYLRIVHTY